MGQPRYNAVFPKHKKDWVAKPIKEAKTYEYVPRMLHEVVKRREHGTTGGDMEVPNLPPNIASVPKPDKEKLIRLHATRFAS